MSQVTFYFSWKMFIIKPIYFADFRLLVFIHFIRLTSYLGHRWLVDVPVDLGEHLHLIWETIVRICRFLIVHLIVINKDC